MALAFSLRRGQSLFILTIIAFTMANYLEPQQIMTDQEIRDIAIKEFSTKARAKFDAGTLEHNPDGTKGLGRLSALKIVQAAKEEAWDQIFYLTALEQQLIVEM